MPTLHTSPWDYGSGPWLLSGSDHEHEEISADLGVIITGLLRQVRVLCRRPRDEQFRLLLELNSWWFTTACQARGIIIITTIITIIITIVAQCSVVADSSLGLRMSRAAQIEGCCGRLEGRSGEEKAGWRAIPSPSSVGKVFGEPADKSLSPTADWPKAARPSVR
jgi:hypothetical protein